MAEVTAIIVAGGSGSRMGSSQIPKQFLKLLGVPILVHTLRIFDQCRIIDRMLLVTRQADIQRCQQFLHTFQIKKVDAIIEGGKERQDSVLNGLAQVKPCTDIVVIHDAVRMFVTEESIDASIRAARRYGASVVAVPVKDTIKAVAASPPRPESGHQDFWVTKTLDRQELWQVQTPQTFQYRLIWEAHQQAREIGFHGTDDAMLVEHFGHPVTIVHGSYRNLKITTPDDLLMAETFLAHGSEADVQQQLREQGRA